MTKEEASNRIGSILAEIEPGLIEIFKIMADHPKWGAGFHFSAAIDSGKPVGDAHFSLLDPLEEPAAP